MKKIISLLLALVLVFITFTVNAQNVNLVLSNGNTVYYKGTTTAVTIPTEYKMQDRYFRGAWVTPLAGSIPSYSASTYKNEIIEMFDILEYYNVNALMFHIRIMNDALYPSTLNPSSSYMKTSTDQLTWVIEECHKRGIEFHAWMNPYRVQSSGSKDMNVITSRYKNFPKNPASSSSNLLMNDSGGVILNPALPNVRQFIVDTVMEVLDKYDVDAIHFDDYFYITGVNDDTYFANDNPNNLSKSAWRREQVDKFIKLLSDSMREYNKKNNRFVQLGISPTGIYRNGDGNVTYDENGNAITSGSKTGGQEHYESYLFSDTLKWINEEWIDYICPQSYWGFSHPIAGYADVMSWWDKVVKHKKVNLYSGMGIYMSATPGSNYSWGFDSNESVNQILYASTLENVSGTVFYSYNYLEAAYKGNTSSLYGKGLTRIKNEIFTKKAIIPHIKSMNCPAIPVSKITSFSKQSDKVEMSFEKVENAKFYVLYRSEKTITYAPEEVYDIFGSSEDIIKYTDTNLNGKEYNYAIKVLSKDNTLSEPTIIGSVKYKVQFKDEAGNLIREEEVYHGESVKAPLAPVKPNEEFLTWSRDLSSVTENMVVYPKYTNSTFTVTLYDDENNVIEVLNYKYNDVFNPNIPVKEGYNFVKWDKDITNVKYDLELYASFTPKIYKVTFVDYDDKVIKEYEIVHGRELSYPPNPTRTNYVFVGWSENVTTVTSDITLKAVYKIETVVVTFINNITNDVISTVEIDKGTNAPLPEDPYLYGHKFTGWVGTTTNVTHDSKVRAMFEEIAYIVTYLDAFDNVIEEREVFWFEDPYYPEINKELEDGRVFVKWDTDLSKLPDDKTELTVKPIYGKTVITVKYVCFDEVIKEETFKINDELTLTFPEAKTKEGYTFVKWEKDALENFEDTTINAIYNQNEYEVKVIDKDGNVVTTLKVLHGEDCDLSLVTVKEYSGFKFKGFDSEGKNVTSNMEIKMIYEQESKNSSCSFLSVIDVLFTLSLTVVLLKITKKH